jgi:hypothetical protein
MECDEAAEDYDWEGIGCLRWREDAPEEEPEDEPEMCCMAMTAECMACAEGVNLPRFCRKNKDLYVEECAEVYDCMHDKSCAE